MEFKNYLSVTLLIAIICKDLPLKVIQHFLKRAMSIMQSRHANLFDRLADENLSFIIDASDLPFIFYMQPNKQNPTLVALKRTERVTVSATIKGTLLNLLKLFEGKLDADAAFFSKDIIIEGSTAASVALRNAVDSENMDIIKDLSEIFKPFDKIFKIGMSVANKTYIKVQNDINLLSEALLLNHSHKITSLHYKLEDTQDDLRKIWLALNKIEKQPIRKKSDYVHK